MRILNELFHLGMTVLKGDINLLHYFHSKRRQFLYLPPQKTISDQLC